MRITNQSEAVLFISENGGKEFPLPAGTTLKPTARIITIRVSRLPCTIEVKDDGKSETG